MKVNSIIIKSMILTVLFIIPYFFAYNVTAEENFICKDFNGEKSEIFSDIQNRAIEINKLVCEALTVPKESNIMDIVKNVRLDLFAAEVKEQVTEKFKNVKFSPKSTFQTILKKQLDFFEMTLKEGVKYPSFQIDNKGKTKKKYLFYFDGNQDDNFGILTYQENKKCIDETGVTCSKILNNLENSIEPYKDNLSAFISSKEKNNLSKLSNEWDAYFEVGRGQTFFDVLLTTCRESSHFEKNYLVGPPKRQWYTIHPAIVVEHLGQAPDGDELETSLAVEVVGFNFWKKCSIGIPTFFWGKIPLNIPFPMGAAVTSLYSDRPNINDVGLGISLYINNTFTFGWTNHGGDDNGFFISIDLLKMVDDKKTKISYYRDKIKKMHGK